MENVRENENEFFVWHKVDGFVVSWEILWQLFGG
jgi:hypothetical protein